MGKGRENCGLLDSSIMFWGGGDECSILLLGEGEGLGCFLVITLSVIMGESYRGDCALGERVWITYGS